jgi:hypothetical protein
MSANTSPVFPLTPIAPTTSLAAVTACSTRAPTASAGLAAANIVALVASQTNGCKIDRIHINACSSSITAPTVAQTVLIWLFDATTAWVIDEILVTAVTPSTTAAAFSVEKTYSNLVIPTGYSLYVSTTVTTTASTTALQVTAFGGAF